MTHLDITNVGNIQLEIINDSNMLFSLEIPIYRLCVL